MRHTTALLLLLFTGYYAAFASDNNTPASPPQVILAADTNLSYQGNDNPSGFTYFKGQANATGLMAAYWEAHYTEAEPTSLQDATPIREMYLRFYPDASSQGQLPSFLSPSGSAILPQRVFLYRHPGPDEQPGMLVSAYTQDDLESIKRLVEHFSGDTGRFLRYREGVMVQPVEITLDNLLTFVEGDHRFLYGQLHTLTPLSTHEYLLKQIPDSDSTQFLGKPWVELLYSPHVLAVHEAPDQEARIIAELPSGSRKIRKIRTIDENWVLIELTGETHASITGYARKAALFPVN